MGLYTGRNGLYTGHTGRHGLYAGPKYKADSFSPSRLPGLLAWYDPSLGEGTGFTVFSGSPRDGLGPVGGVAVIA